MDEFERDLPPAPLLASVDEMHKVGDGPRANPPWNDDAPTTLQVQYRPAYERWLQ